MTDLRPGLLLWLACLAAVIVGAAIRRPAAQGFGMVAIPVMAMAAPGWLPGTVFLVGLCIGAGAGPSRRSAMVLRDLPPGFAGRTLGAALAAWIAARAVGPPALPFVTGGGVLAAVALSAPLLRVAIRPATRRRAGTVAGVTGTPTGIGAPPMAILYPTVDARMSTAPQTVFFASGMAVSIAGLTLAGGIGWRHPALAVTLAPAVPLTHLAVRPRAARMAERWARPIAPGPAGVAARVLIVRSLAGTGEGRRCGTAVRYSRTSSASRARAASSPSRARASWPPSTACATAGSTTSSAGRRAAPR